MQKIRVFLLFVLLAGMCIPLHAQWTARSTSQSGGDTITELSGTSGRTARVISASSLTGAETALIGNCLDAVWALPGIQGQEASVRMENNGFRFAVYPTSLSYKEQDFAPLLPSGLGFYYRSSLFYDVTLKVDNLMPKVSGAYVSPEGFLEHLESAVQAPALFMYDGSMAQRMERIEGALMALIAKSPPKTAVAPATVNAVINARNENPAITPAQTVAVLQKQGIKTTVKEVTAVFIVFFGF